MSFIPWRAVKCLPSGGDTGKEKFVLRSWMKESEGKTSWKIVSLRVPGTADHQKSTSVPNVIRICQEPRPQKKPRKKFHRAAFVIVPESSDFGAPEKRQSSEMCAASCVPSIKRCSLDEIEAIKRSLERAARKVNSRNAAEKGRGRRHRSSEVHRHVPAPRRRVRTGMTT